MNTFHKSLALITFGMGMGVLVTLPEDVKATQPKETPHISHSRVRVALSVPDQSTFGRREWITNAGVALHPGGQLSFVDEDTGREVIIQGTYYVEAIE